MAVVFGIAGDDQLFWVLSAALVAALIVAVVILIILCWRYCCTRTCGNGCGCCTGCAPCGCCACACCTGCCTGSTCIEQCHCCPCCPCCRRSKSKTKVHVMEETTPPVVMVQPEKTDLSRQFVIHEVVVKSNEEVVFQQESTPTPTPSPMREPTLDIFQVESTPLPSPEPMREFTPDVSAVLRDDPTPDPMTEVSCHSTKNVIIQEKVPEMKKEPPVKKEPLFIKRNFVYYKKEIQIQEQKKPLDTRGQPMWMPHKHRQRTNLKFTTTK